MSSQTAVSIFMGSKSDLPVVQAAADTLAEFDISFNMYILSAHRTPEEVVRTIKESEQNGVKVFIAAAGMAAHLAGAIAAQTTKPVLGIPLAGGDLDGMDALLAIAQMPPGIPVATVAINGSLNAAILATQMMGTNNEEIYNKTVAYKKELKNKIVKANQELAEKKFKFRVN